MPTSGTIATLLGIKGYYADLMCGDQLINLKKSPCNNNLFYLIQFSLNVSVNTECEQLASFDIS